MKYEKPIIKITSLQSEDILDLSNGETGRGGSGSDGEFFS